VRKVACTIAAGAVAGVLATGLVFTAASPALADNAGASCRLSKNWPVKFSAAYEPVTANSSHISYLVMNTPGAVKKWQFTVYSGTGAVVLGPLYWSNPPNLARVDTNVRAGFPKIKMEVWGPNSSYCKTEVIAFTA
jgi:hypothetical protein